MRARRVLTVLLLVAGLQAGTSAHEVPNEVTVLAFLRPQAQTLEFLLRVPMASLRDISYPVDPGGYLQISAADAALRDAATLWVSDFVELYENGEPLPKPTVRAVRVALPSSRSFQSYDTAMATLRSPALPDDTHLVWEQGVLDVLFEYPITSDQSQFAIHPGFTRLGLQVNIGLRFLAPGQPERVFDVHADVGVVELDPRWYQASWLFVKEGFWHILDGTDHLLFLLCLVIPFRRLRPLLVVVTAFTIAHSFTLLASAYDVAPDALWFPPLVETLIAASIFYMALENILGTGLQRRWAMTFAFGLVHGFGFSFLLRENGCSSPAPICSSLLAFNVGVRASCWCWWSSSRRSATSSPGGGRADGRHHPVHDRGAHGLALDDRTVGDAQPVPVARHRRAGPGQPHALGHGRHRHRRDPVVDVGDRPPVGRAGPERAAHRRALSGRCPTDPAPSRGTTRWRWPPPLRSCPGSSACTASSRATLPPLPIARLMDIQLVEVSERRAVFESTPQEFHYNPIGVVHGGFAATILDSAMGCAVHTLLPARVAYTTLEFKVNFVKG
ncbi:MAG: HupE/UreJ family protein [Vicinamibacterales bacterium]